MKNIQRFYIINIVVFGITVLLFVFGGQLSKYIQNNTLNSPLPAHTETLIISTLAPSLLNVYSAVILESTPCYFGTNEGYDSFVIIPQFTIVSILGNDFSGEWTLVRLESFADCWTQSTSVQLQGNGNLPLITTSFPPLITPVPSTAVVTTQIANQTPIPSIELTWKILSFDCLDGRATRALVDLNVSGGVPPYSYSQQLPMYARPEQIVSITVKSSTQDGEPSIRIRFPVPRAPDFKCDKEGNNPIIQLPTPKPACSDGKDNDSDSFVDYGSDPQCDSPNDSHEDS